MNNMSDVESVQELSRMIAENMNRQFEREREREAKREADREMERQREREREEANFQRLAIIVGEQRESSKLISYQLGKIHQEMEKARGRTLQRLPEYDGRNMNFDVWEDTVVAILKCNDWSLGQLLESLPISLSGLASLSFNNLQEEEKISKEAFFQALRQKIDPESESRNREYFMDAQKRTGESMAAFIDRCRMYIRRSRGDPEERFLIELLKRKVIGNMQLTDRKILQAAIKPSDDLNIMVTKADLMMSDRPVRVGLVTENGSSGLDHLIEENTTGFQNISHEQTVVSVKNNHDKLATSKDSTIGPCGKCHKKGHTRRHCPLRIATN